MKALFEDRVATIIEEFHKLTKLQCRYYALADTSFNFEEMLAANCFCEAISKEFLGKRMCSIKEQKVAETAIYQKRPFTTTCHAGLNIFAIPVLINDAVVGLFWGCYVVRGTLNAIRNQMFIYVDKYDVQENSFMDIMQEIPLFQGDDANAVVELLHSLIRLNMAGGHKQDNAEPITNDSYDSGDLALNRNQIRPMSWTANYMKDRHDGYASSVPIRTGIIDEIFANIRAKNLVKGKEYYKKLFQSIYLEESVEYAKFDAMLLIYAIYDNFLLKISHYSRMYQATAAILTRVAAAVTTEELRRILADYYDELVDIYSSNANNKNVIIERVRLYLNNHYMEPVSIAKLAQDCNVSISYLSREFKKQFGVSTKEYLNNVRMFQAQHLIRHTNLPMTEIAEKVGYPDVRSFYKMYNKFFDIPTSQLRILQKRNDTGDTEG